jgi:hypothetical protein
VRKLQYEEIYGPYKWTPKGLWRVKKLETRTLPTTALLWHLDIEFQWAGEDDEVYSATTREIMAAPKSYPSAYAMITEVDLDFPLEVVNEGDRWVILDGIRRLAKLNEQNLTMVNVRVHDRTAFLKPEPQIRNKKKATV